MDLGLQERYREIGHKAGWVETIQKYKMDLTVRYSGGSVLDIGCATGLYVNELSRMGYDAVGVDSHLGFLKQAREGPGRFICFDIETNGHLPFADSRFDTVLILDLLEHIDNQKRLLEEACRVCQRNVLVAVPNKRPRALEGTPWYFHTFLDPTHVRYYDYDELRQMLEAVGFTDVQLVYQFKTAQLISYSTYPKTLKSVVRFLNWILNKCAHVDLSIHFAVNAHKPGCRTSALTRKIEQALRCSRSQDRGG